MKKGLRTTAVNNRVKGNFPACDPGRAGEGFPMFLAWTTVATKADAEALAARIISRNHAACVQIDGPILSLYRWNGKTERSEEFRLLVKCVEAQLPGLERCVLSQHPYETPEWIVVRADSVGEKYLSWAKANSTNPPL